MRDRSLSIVMLAAALPCMAAGAQSAAMPCSAPEYAQFDFWLGTWSVTNEGKPAGANRIEKVLDGCALHETWRSVGEHRGESLTFYDAARDRWHQTWIDVAGEPLYLDGRFADGKMRLEGTRPAAEGGKPVLHRIEWTPLTRDVSVLATLSGLQPSALSLPPERTAPSSPPAPSSTRVKTDRGPRC